MTRHRKTPPATRIARPQAMASRMRVRVFTAARCYGPGGNMTGRGTAGPEEAVDGRHGRPPQGEPPEEVRPAGRHQDVRRGAASQGEGRGRDQADPNRAPLRGAGYGDVEGGLV